MQKKRFILQKALFTSKKILVFRHCRGRSNLWINTMRLAVLMLQHNFNCRIPAFVTTAREGFKYFLLLLVFTACDTELIDLKVDDYKQNIVIECLLDNRQFPHQLQVTYTVPYGDTTTVKTQDSCAVYITDSYNNRFTFTHVNGGIYQNSVLKLIKNQQYNLTVTDNNMQYHAAASVPAVGRLDSLVSYTGYNPQIGKKSTMVHMHATRPYQDTTSYFRIILQVNDSVYNGLGDIIVYDDTFLEKHYVIDIYYAFEPGDTVIYHLYSLDRNMLVYYDDLNYAMQIGSFGSSMGHKNPQNNITGGALGFFQLSEWDSDTVVINYD